MIRAAATLLLLAALRPAVAETYPVGPVRVEVPTTPGRAACFDKADGNDLAMAACEAAEAAAWDRRLNAAFGRLRTALPSAEFARLQTAQRAWIVYRDHECASDPAGGTVARVEAASCTVRMTATRAAELEARTGR
jgi:uncharacterized protein YecT (DUF1311 family)